MKRRLAVLGLLFATTLAFVAHAEPTAAEKETARGLVDVGDKKIEAGDLAGALKAYQAAHAIMNVPTTGLEVAKTLEKLGRLSEARETALEIGRAHAKNGEPQVFAEARAEADKLADRLESKIPALIVEVAGAPDGVDPVVKIDKAALPVAALGLPRRVDPGKHVVTAEAPGRRLVRVEVGVDEGERLPVKLVLVPPAGPEADAPTTTPKGGAEGDSGVPTLALVGFVGGGAGFLVGTITGIASLAKASSAKTGCRGNVCPAANQSDADASTALATVSDIGFGLAVLGVGVGVYEIVTKKPPAKPAATTSLVVGPRGASLLVRF